MTTKNATPALTFSDVDVPTSSRPGMPNPFIEIVASMTVGGKAKTGPVPMLEDDEDETAKRAEARVERQLTEAGDKRNVSVRRTFQGEPGKRTVTFWVVNKITRKPAAAGDAS